jgi:hypothetical protein
MANEALSVPYTPGNTNVLKGINWRVIPATAIAAFMFSGLESVNPQAAKGLAALALVTTLLVGMGNAPAPAANIAKALGYGSGNTSASVVGPNSGVTITRPGGGSFGFTSWGGFMQSTFQKAVVGVIGIAMLTTVLLPNRQTVAALGGVERLSTGALSVAEGTASGSLG